MVSPAERLNSNTKGGCKSFLAENPSSCGIWIEFSIKKACIPAMGIQVAPDCLQGGAKNPSQTKWFVLNFEVWPGAKGGYFWAPLLSVCWGGGPDKSCPSAGLACSQPGSQGRALFWGSIRSSQNWSQCFSVHWVRSCTSLVSQKAASPFAALLRCIHWSQAMWTTGLNGLMPFLTFCYFWYNSG